MQAVEIFLAQGQTSGAQSGIAHGQMEEKVRQTKQIQELLKIIQSGKQ